MLQPPSEAIHRLLRAGVLAAGEPLRPAGSRGSGSAVAGAHGCCQVREHGGGVARRGRGAAAAAAHLVVVTVGFRLQPLPE